MIKEADTIEATDSLGNAPLNRLHYANQKDILVLLLVNLWKKEMQVVSLSDLHRVWHIVIDMIRKRNIRTESLNWNNVRRRYDGLDQILSTTICSGFSRNLAQKGDIVTLDFTHTEVANAARCVDEKLEATVDEIAPTILLHLRT